MTNSKKLEKRLEQLEVLHRQRKLSDSQYDILDSVARVEAGALSYQDILDEFVPKKKPRVEIFG